MCASLRPSLRLRDRLKPTNKVKDAEDETFYKPVISEHVTSVLKRLKEKEVIYSHLLVLPRGYKSFFMLNSAEHEN